MRKGKYLTVTQAARLLGEKPQTVRYYIRHAETLPALQSPAREGASKARYRIRPNDLVAFARRRGSTEAEIAAMEKEIDAMLGMAS